MKVRIALLAVLMTLASVAQGEEIKIASYNIEHFQNHFSAFKYRKDKTIPDFAAKKDILDQLKRTNDEDNWETSQVILDKNFSPDILCIEEGCDEDNLKHFNKRWLREAYETVIQFPTNTEFDQHLDMLLKPGFKVLETKADYYKEKDPVGNERGERLFARGPAFVLVQSPSGYKFWVGLTHQKSKRENSVVNTQWRNREAKRTHEIMKELIAQGPTDVILCGDMNDEIGEQEFEKEGGGDTVTNIVGPKEDGFILATQPIVDAGRISFGGYFSDFHRSLIDHIICSPTVQGQIKSVEVFHNNFTDVSSDHFPILMTITADPVPPAGPAEK